MLEQEHGETITQPAKRQQSIFDKGDANESCAKAVSNKNKIECLEVILEPELDDFVLEPVTNTPLSTQSLCDGSKGNQREENFHVTRNFTTKHAALSTLTTRSTEEADVNVLIAREPPHRFCMMSPLFLQLFRFKSQDLSSSSLRLIYGPKTDVQAVRNLIARPAACASAVPIIFYRKDGEEVPCFVRVLSSALAHDDACTLAFEADAGCCASPRTQSAAPHVVGRQDTDSRGDAKSGGEHLPTCSLLSPGDGIDRAVRIHVRAMRAASGSSKRRQAVLDSTQDGS